MIQYGDIRKLSGYDLEPVDLIVGGSPCQDLSIAGQRKGLEGERSGLFLEMIRVIKEMIEATDGIYPRFVLFENVPGIFSTNEGRDFGSVLGEFARIIEPGSPDVPTPKEGWNNAGVLLVSGRGSIAYRTHNSQYWGVAQRRRRVALIMDLRGESAPEILFEPKGSAGNPGQGQEKRQKYSGTVADSIRKASVYDPSVHHDYREFDDVSETVRSRYGTGGNNQPLVVEDGMPVRKLTPVEAERLQGFPDNWTLIPGTTDSKRFRALGNSIALPFGLSSPSGLSALAG